MGKEIIDMRDLATDHSFFGKQTLLLAVKSFDLQAIRKRYLASRKRSKSGSVERREPANGGLVLLEIENGIIIKTDIVARLKEPRGIDIGRRLAAVSSEDRIFVFSKNGSHPDEIDYQWLSYIHTVRFNEHESRLLVSSSGVDSLLEFDCGSGEILWEWDAWENGFDCGENPDTGEKHYLTRSPAKAEELSRKGKKPLLVTDPKKEPLPTALRAAFMNSAEYDTDGNILTTLFHHGQVMKVDYRSMSTEVLAEGLAKPHGGMPFRDGYLVTDTGGGRVVLRSKNGTVGYDFSRLPGKAEEVKELEWLQFSRNKDSMIATLDSNRTAIVFFDIVAGKKMIVPYDPNWALQEFVFVTKDNTGFVEIMNNWFVKAEKE